VQKTCKRNVATEFSQPGIALLRQARWQHSDISPIQGWKIFQNSIDGISAGIHDDQFIGNSGLRFDAREEALQLSRTIHRWNDKSDFGTERVQWLHARDLVRLRMVPGRYLEMFARMNSIVRRSPSSSDTRGSHPNRRTGQGR